MISDFLVPAQGVMGGRDKENCAVACPIHITETPNLVKFRKNNFLDRQVPSDGHDPGDQMGIWSNMFNIFYQ